MKQVIVDNISTTYYITEDGKCYNEKTNKWLKGQTNYKNGYFSYNLTMPDGTKKRRYAHRLVANAFIPNPNNLPQINHKDGNKLNNCIDNLEWCSSKENAEHAIKNNLRKLNHVFCFNKDKKLVAEYFSIADAHRATKISESEICKNINISPKTLCGNFYWSWDKELGETVAYKNTGKAKEVYQYDLNGKFITSYPSTGTAARALGMPSHGHISECCRGKLKSCYGFIWKYAEDIVSSSVKAEGE